VLINKTFNIVIPHLGFIFILSINILFVLYLALVIILALI